MVLPASQGPSLASGFNLVKGHTPRPWMGVILLMEAQIMSYNCQCLHFDAGMAYTEGWRWEQVRSRSCTLSGWEHTDPDCENCEYLVDRDTTNDSSL
jgi:hypothetical protein